MAQHILARDGQRPLEITGEVVAEESGRWQRGKDQHRYTEVTVYQCADDRYVVAWTYVSHWQGESDHAVTEICPSLVYLGTALEDFNPCQWLIGFRPQIDRAGTEESKRLYQQRQEGLERELRTMYAGQVSRICTALDITEKL